jgi:hypothetical protein
MLAWHTDLVSSVFLHILAYASSLKNYSTDILKAILQVILLRLILQECTYFGSFRTEEIQLHLLFMGGSLMPPIHCRFS